MLSIKLLCIVTLYVGVLEGSTQKEAITEYLADQLVRTGNLLNELPSLQNNDCSSAAVSTNRGPVGDLASPEWPCNVTKRDCLEHFLNACSMDGVYKIDPARTGQVIRAYCDMSAGGWTVIQRRVDDTVNFFRDWGEYDNGFGFLSGNMWLGLGAIHKLTKPTEDEISELYIHMESFEGETRYAKYSKFYIDDHKEFYKLHVSNYTGDAGDSFGGHNGAKFSTYDLDLDTYTKNCAIHFRGGWWYTKCHSSNLNGLYLGGNHTSYANGINYRTWKTYYYSLKKTVMKVRREPKK